MPNHQMSALSGCNAIRRSVGGLWTAFCHPYARHQMRNRASSWVLPSDFTVSSWILRSIPGESSHPNWASITTVFPIPINYLALIGMEQKIEGRYLDRRRLLKLLEKLFPAKNYSVRVSRRTCSILWGPISWWLAAAVELLDFDNSQTPHGGEHERASTRSCW